MRCLFYWHVWYCCFYFSSLYSQELEIWGLGLCWFLYYFLLHFLGYFLFSSWFLFLFGLLLLCFLVLLGLGSIGSDNTVYWARLGFFLFLFLFLLLLSLFFSFCFILLFSSFSLFIFLLLLPFYLFLFFFLLSLNISLCFPYFYFLHFYQILCGESFDIWKCVLKSFCDFKHLKIGCNIPFLFLIKYSLFPWWCIYSLIITLE